jgi:valyl-tRNA synthetase
MEEIIDYEAIKEFTFKKLLDYYLELGKKGYYTEEEKKSLLEELSWQVGFPVTEEVLRLTLNILERKKFLWH